MKFSNSYDAVGQGEKQKQKTPQGPQKEPSYLMIHIRQCIKAFFWLSYGTLCGCLYLSSKAAYTLWKQYNEEAEKKLFFSLLFVYVGIVH